MSSSDLDEAAEERRNVRNLVRWVSAFVAWPALSISIVMLLDVDEHVLHIAGLLPLGIVALAVFMRADAIARRFYPAAG